MIKFSLPGKPWVDSFGEYSKTAMAWLSWVTDRINQLTMVGTTAERPTEGLRPGWGPYFDTTINRPIWRNAANNNWIRADGTVV